MARAAPSLRARNFGHTTVGCTSGAYDARDENPQSAPAITFSRADEPGVLHDVVGDQLGVLDVVRGVADADPG